MVLRRGFEVIFDEFCCCFGCCLVADFGATMAVFDEEKQWIYSVLDEGSKIDLPFPVDRRNF